MRLKVEGYMAKSKKLKYGVWLKGTETDSIIGIPFDYIEMEFKSVASMDENSYFRMQSFFQKKGIDVMCMNCFLPKEYTILSPDFKKDITPYLEIGFRRASLLGTKIVVFGSPKSRCKVNGISKEAFERIFLDALFYICEFAARYDIKIVLEPICSKESNTINTIAEAEMIAKKMDYQIGTLCDLYHMKNMNEDNIILKNFKSLCHCHIVNPLTRYCPKEDDEYSYSHFISNVVQTEKIESMTIEVPVTDCYIDINKSIKLLNRLEAACKKCIL